MSIEDPRLSSIDNTSAVDEFDSAVEQHLGFAQETVDGIEVAQAETPDAGRTDRLPAQAPVETAAAILPGEISPDAENVVTLPAGIELDNLEFAVEGDNLVLVLADGTEIVVLGGAANIPTFVIGDLELPQVALFAALEGSNINVAAGPDGTFSAQGSPTSSRNFNDNPIDAGPEDLALADLLDDTDFGDDAQGNAIFGGSGTPSIPLEIALTEPFIYDEAVIADGDAGNQIITGVLPFNPGPDFGTISRVNFAGAINVDEEGLGPQILTGFTSGGRPITVTSFAAPVDGADLDFVALEGRDSEGTLIFTLTITNRETGAFEFELIGKIDHPDAGADGAQDDLDDLLRLGFTYTVTDLDGDSVTGSFSIDVMDDAPTFGEADAGAVDEDYLDNGNVDGEDDIDGFPPKEEAFRLLEVSEPSSGGTVATGSLGINWGADNGNVGGNAGLTGAADDRGVAFTKATIDALNAKGLKSDGVTLQYDLSPDGTTIVAYKPNDGEGEPVFTVTVSDIAANGSYKFNLLGNIDHPDTSTEDDIAIEFAFTVQDSDGDTASSSFTVTVNDDSPILVGDAEAITLTVDEDDIDTSTSTGSAPNDGDQTDGSFTGAPGVNTGGPANATSTTGSLLSLVSVGADENVTFSLISIAAARTYLESLGLTSNGLPLGFDIDESGKITGFVNSQAPGQAVPGQEYNAGPDRLVFEFEVNADGTFKFSLSDQLDHIEDDGNGETLTIDFGSVLQVNDGDGDSVKLTNLVKVNITDDAPVLSGARISRTVDEDDIETGQSIGTSPNDGNGDGSFTGSPSNNQPGPGFISGSLAGLVKGGADDTVKFAFIDEDAARDALEALGLKSKGQELSYDIRDGVLYAFDNAGPYQGVSYDNGDRLVFKLTLGENGSYTFELVDQLDHDAGKGQNTDLQDGLPGGDVEAIDFGSIIKATDFDGDSVVLKGAFSVTIRDDVPELSGAKISRTVDEDDIRTSQSLGTSPADGESDGSWTGGPGQGGNGGAFIDGSLSGLVKGGADDTVKFAFIDEDAARDALEALGLKSKGQELSYDIRDGVLYAFDNAGPYQGVSYDNGDRLVFKLTLGENGSYTFELVDQLDHDAGKGQNTDLQDGLPRGDVEAIDFGSIIKATDFDGDSVVLKGAFSVTIRDDVPELSGAKISRTVDEDDIRTSQSLGTSPADGESDGSWTGGPGQGGNGGAFIDGSLSGLVKGGADDTVKFAFIDEDAARDALEALGLKSKGQELSYDIRDGVLYAFDNAGPYQGVSYDNGDRLVFKLTLGENGSYTFELVDQLDHDHPFDDRGDGQGIADENFDLQDGVRNADVTAINFGKLITATDYDGDSISLDGAFSIKVRDDIPEAVARNTSATLVVDETSGQQNDDVAGSITLFNGVANKGTDPNMSAQYAQQASFVAADIDGGADDDVKVDWSLKLNGSNGLASGLMTTEGRSIVLFLEGDLIVGRYDRPMDGNTSVNSSDPAAFALHLSDNGTLSLVQYVSIRHDDPADHDEHNDAADGNLSTVLQTLAGKINAVLTVTDFDGDKAVSEIAVGDRIQFEDDGPVVSGAAVTKTADEDDLYNAQSQGTSPDGDSELALLGLGFAATVRGSVGSVVNFGADGAAAGGGFLLTANAAATMTTLGLESKGGDLSYQVFGNAILAYVNGGNSAAFDSIFDRPVFSLELDPQTGDFVYRQYDQLDHVAGGAENTALQGASGPLAGIDFGAIIIAKDGDGDIVNLTGKLTINVVDDIPEVAIWTDRTVTIDETDYRQNDDTTSQTVAAQFAGLANVGSDIDMLQSPIFARDDVIDLSYVTGADENVTKSLTLQIDNAASGVQTTSGQDIVLFLEGGLVVGRVGGAQGAAAFAIAIDSDGDVSVAQYMSLKHPNTGSADEGIDLSGKISAVFSVKDFDGDTVTKSVSIGNKIVFEDDGPTVTPYEVNTMRIISDDDTVVGANGNPGFGSNPSDGSGSDSKEYNKTGTLKFSAGADGGTVAWNLDNISADSGAAGITFSVTQSGTLLIFQNQGGVSPVQVAQVTLDAVTGKYVYTQTANLLHTAGGDENEASFTLGFTVTDGDGDKANGKLTLLIDDDTPTGGAGTTAWLNDDALAGGNPGGTGDNGLANTSNVLKHSFGADGAGSIAWTGISVVGGGNAADFTSSVSPDGKTLQVFQAGNLVITGVLNPLTGQYTLTQNAPIDHLPGGDENEVKFQFKYDVTDGDGDVAPGYIWVNADDDTPTGGAGTTAWLNDDALAGGNPGGTGDNGLANTSNVLKHSFGADGAGSIAWTGISVVGGGNAADFTSSVSPDGKTLQVFQAGNLVITGVLNPLTGQYTLTQNAPIDHLPGGDENEVKFQFKYDVTDGDGDVAPGYIWVNVDDDTPMAKGLAQVGSLSETGLPTVSFDFGDLNVGIGADKKGTHVEIGTLNGQPVINSNLTSDGVPLEYIVRTTNGVDQELVAFKSGSSADDPVFIVAVLRPASFATTLFQNVDHLGSNDNVLALNLVARVFDGDGDYVDQPFTININDSEPTALDLTAAMGENQSIEIPLTEGTNFSFGADSTDAEVSIGTVTLSDGPLGVTLGTPSVTFDPNTNKISIVPGTAFDALAAGQTVVLHIPYTVMDGDGDTITKDIAVTVTGTNDGPIVANAIADQSIQEEGTVNFTVPANAFGDVDSASLSYTATLDNGDALPSWLTFNAATRAFSGTAPLDYNGAIDVKVTASDGSESVSDTFKLTVTPVNDAPVLSDVGGTLAYTEGQTARVIDGSITITDVDDTNIEGATVQISNNYASGQDVLSFTDQNGITGNWNAATGTLTLSGSASKANYELALESIKYQNTSDNPSTASRTVSFSVTDGDASSHVGTVSVTVTATASKIEGNALDNTLSGTAGDDTILGYFGDDDISGGNGNDTLIGGLGWDTVSGGGGNDAFVLEGSSSAYDIITDFVSADDILHFINFSLANHSGAGAINSVVTINGNGNLGGGNNDTNISGADLVVLNVNADIANSASEINVILDAQRGTFDGGVFVLAYAQYNGANKVALYYDGDANGTSSGARLVAIFPNYNSVTTNGAPNIAADFAAISNIADPIILDLDKNGFAFSSIDNGVTFDINADGKADQIAWTSDDGILAYDIDGNGLIDNGSEMFTPDFNGGAFASGVAALASLDSNGDGKIDASDDAFSKLSVWVDANNNGVSDEGELSSLTDHGVTSISLTTNQTGGTEDDQTIFAEGEFTFADGSTGNFVEVGFDTIFGSDLSDGLTVIGTDGDDILHGGMGQVVMTGGAGADTFVFDETALSELDVADVITDFNSDEGDVLDVTALLDSLLGEQATAETAASHLRATVEDGNTTVSVQTGADTWKDVVVLNNHDTAVKVLFDDKHSVTVSHD